MEARMHGKAGGKVTEAETIALETAREAYILAAELVDRAGYDWDDSPEEIIEAMSEVLVDRISPDQVEIRRLRAQVEGLQNHCTHLVEDRRSQCISYQVREFNEAFGYKSEVRPTVNVSDIDVRLRARLVAEEFFELMSSLFDDDSRGLRDEWWMVAHDEVFSRISGLPISIDLEALADACADLDYVVEGTRLRFGLPRVALAREVHRSNMAKKGGEYVDGKLQKPPNWTPPDIAGVLRRAG